MNISSITFNYSEDKKVSGYTVYVDGEEGDLQTFSGQVVLRNSELDLSYIAGLVQEKIARTFGGAVDAD